MFEGDELVGYVTSAWYSPAQEANIAFAMLPAELTEFGTRLSVALPASYADAPVAAEVVETPFKKPASPGTGMLKTGRKL